MELRNIKTFIKVAEYENLSKAAEELGYAQSTITMQIHQLEEELGAALFDRIGKRVFLSQKGQVFLPYAHHMAKLEYESIEAIAVEDVPTGTLRIGTLESIATSFFLPLLEQYIKMYPKVSVVVSLGTTLELYEQLEKGLLDMVLLCDRPVFHQNLQMVYTTPASVCFFASKEHPFAKSKQISTEQLKCERLILTEKNNHYRLTFDEIAMKRNEVFPNILEFANSTSALALVEKNLGIGLLPHYRLQPALEKGTIQPLSVEGYDIHLDLQILYHQQKFISLAMRCFTELTEKYLTDTPAF